MMPYFCPMSNVGCKLAIVTVRAKRACAVFSLIFVYLKNLRGLVVMRIRQGAMMINGSPLDFADASARMFEFPICSAFETTADATDAPFVNVLIVTSSPACLKKPSSSA